MEYKLISADSHVVEPPDIWTSRVPKKFVERAPHMVSLDNTDAWILEGVPNPILFGLTQCGGFPPEQYSPYIRWEDVRPSAYDPAARIVDMDKDRLDAEIEYPGPSMGNGLFANDGDTEFHVACIRAYNDWLSEWCSHDPERLGGQALLPNVGTGPAIEEMHRVMEMPGIVGVMIGRFPAGGMHLSPEDDTFLAACQEADIPVNIHVGLASPPPAPGAEPSVEARFAGAFTGAFRYFNPPALMAEFIFTKTLDRFPKLKVMFAEVDVGWIPYLREQLDGRYERQHPDRKVGFELKPSEYFERNYYYTIVMDAFGIKSRHDVGVDSILWSNDFPHATCD